MIQLYKVVWIAQKQNIVYSVLIHNVIISRFVLFCFYDSKINISKISTNEKAFFG